MNVYKILCLKNGKTQDFNLGCMSGKDVLEKEGL